ncbi:MAG: Cna B-type domain-containing protein [Oscillospiraceae bacterium]|nr:Cna B-type domain-containing protein [Oscillospiraceae bacterium]
MKKFLKRLSSFVLAFVVAAGFSAQVFAADSTVTYEGNKKGFTFAPGSEYTATDLFDGFKGVMPGDKLTEKITIKNEASYCDYIRVYLKAKAHDEENPLSEGVAASGETVATMTDFLSKLYLEVYEGEDLIYAASPDQTDGLTEPVYLGRLNLDETKTLTVKLNVPIELDNKYAKRVGEVDWVFMAEEFTSPGTPSGKGTLTVHKVWNDNGSDLRPGSIDVDLLRDGEVYDSVSLSESNQWSYTWDKLNDRYDWSVSESGVPDGYEADYSRDGTVVMIVNTLTEEIEEEDPPLAGPGFLTVNKVWAGDEDQLDKRPESVGMTLYNGPEAVETVYLGEWNNWTYTWVELDPAGSWSVLEDTIPKGYVPSYETNGGAVTVTNTATLIQTGQLNWPIAVLGIAGIGLVFCGVLLMRKKRNDNA